MTSFYVYVHCRPDGSPFYVGKGSGRRAYSLKKRNPYHQAIINQFGFENILIVLINCSSEQEAYEKESVTISEIKAYGFRLANFNDGGAGGSNPSLEVREKMSAAKRGITLPPKHKERISATLSGKPKTIEHVAAVANALRGRKPSEACILASIERQTGRQHSEEEKRKRIASNTGKKRSIEFCQRMSEIAKRRYDAGEITTLQREGPRGPRRSPRTRQADGSLI